MRNINNMWGPKSAERLQFSAHKPAREVWSCFSINTDDESTCYLTTCSLSPLLCLCVSAVFFANEKQHCCPHTEHNSQFIKRLTVWWLQSYSKAMTQAALSRLDLIEFYSTVAILCKTSPLSTGQQLTQLNLHGTDALTSGLPINQFSLSNQCL